MSDRLLGTLSEGIPFILSGPTGTGKTTLVRRLTAEFPSVVMSVSFTTRKPREGEVPGRDYVFLTEDQFKEHIAHEDFLEHVCLYGDYYGTSRSWVAQRRQERKHVFLVIDTQGARALQSVYPHVSIFIAPPSIDELRRRLMSRRTESEEQLRKRLDWAEHEMQQQQNYEYVIVNDELDTAYQVLRSIVIAETHHRRWKDSVNEQ
jgi:guanylate kinase